MPLKMHKIIYFCYIFFHNICVSTLPKVFRPVTRSTLIFVFCLSVCGACVKAD